MNFPMSAKNVKGRQTILSLRDNAIDPDTINANLSYWLSSRVVRDGLPIFPDGHAADEFMFDLIVVQGLRFDSYHLEKGACITTVLKKKILHYLKQHFSSRVKNFEKVWPETAKMIRGLYYSKCEVLAFFAPKELVGDGVFEPHETCLRDDGEYSMNGDFFKKYRRGKMLALAVIHDGVINPRKYGGGRCLVHLKGGHRVVLTNAYFTHMPHQFQLFIDAIVKMFNLSKPNVIGANDYHSIGLPVYLNGGARELVFGKRPVWKREHIMPCPRCGKSVKRSHFIFSESDSLGVGCDRCYDGDDDYHSCAGCGRTIHDYQIYSAHNGDEYCERCYNNTFTACEGCGDEIYLDDAGYAANASWCQSCFARKFIYCERCGDPIAHALVVDDQYCSPECAEKGA